MTVPDTSLAVIEPPDRTIWRATVTPFILSVGFTGLCAVAAGATLGLYLGGVVVATALAAYAGLSEPHGWRRALAVGAVVDGVAVVWLVAALTTNVTVGQWLACYILLIAYAASLWGAADLLDALRMPPLLTAAIVTLLAQAWLIWPIWLSAGLSGQGGAAVVAWLVPEHPLFAVNAVLQQHLGIWTEHSLMYRLTNLNQDVPYVLPNGPWVAVSVHGVIAATFLAASARLRRPPGP
jgi:hypothetical protein